MPLLYSAASTTQHRSVAPTRWRYTSLHDSTAAVTSRLQPARAAPPSLLPPCLPSRQPAGRAPLLLCRCWALFPRVAPGAFLGPAALFLSPYATITDLVTAPDGAPPAHPPTTLGPLTQVAVPQGQLRRRGQGRERGTPGLTPPPSPRSEAPRSKLHPCRCAGAGCAPRPRQAGGGGSGSMCFTL